MRVTEIRIDSYCGGCVAPLSASCTLPITIVRYSFELAVRHEQLPSPSAILWLDNAD